MKIISNRPFPKLGINLFKKNYLNDFYNQLLFFDKGRDALIYGLKKLGLKRGMTILCPAYICDSVIQKLFESGYHVVFFDVEKNLKINLNNINEIISQKNINAILFVHYFGFRLEVKSISDICKKFNLILIEDCSHSFLTKYNLSKKNFQGDISIFSMRKILPISDGGALLFKNLKFKISRKKYQTRFSFKNDLLYLIERLVELLVCKFININIYSNEFTDLKETIKKYIPKFRMRKYLNNSYDSYQPKSFLLNLFLRNSYLEYISLSRINNYHYLSRKMSEMGYKPLFESLKDGEVPQFFVFKDNSGNLAKWLKERGIGALSWPGEEIPDSVSSKLKDYKNSIYLNKTLICIPIHEDITLQYYSNLLTKLYKWKNFVTT